MHNGAILFNFKLYESVGRSRRFYPGDTPNYQDKYTLKLLPPSHIINYCAINILISILNTDFDDLISDFKLVYVIIISSLDIIQGGQKVVSPTFRLYNVDIYIVLFTGDLNMALLNTLPQKVYHNATKSPTFHWSEGTTFR